MSTIREVIESNLSGPVPEGYGYIVNDVIDALETREEAIIEALRAYADSRGLDTYEQNVLLANAGLSEYIAVVEEAEDEDRLASLERKVNDLFVLAERHLGSV